MSIPDPALLQTIGQAMVSAAPAGWQSLTLLVSAAARLTNTKLLPEMQASDAPPDVLIDFEGRRAASDLRKAMYQEGKGTWYNASITVSQDGKVTADFDYDNPPLGGLADESNPDSEGWATEDLLLDDQKQFPRDPEHLPPWHPATL
ncbi:antitoxin YezG family protein [Jiangella endophytica]|uniref:immunity protein YezG family protein n=1 Tax=Jiangella endophytica TaxID=1623398 RepID=UPI000E346170|nr:immunity protein YezG family protein [Jiangella endophytica]